MLPRQKPPGRPGPPPGFLCWSTGSKVRPPPLLEGHTSCGACLALALAWLPITHSHAHTTIQANEAGGEAPSRRRLVPRIDSLTRTLRNRLAATKRQETGEADRIFLAGRGAVAHNLPPAGRRPHEPAGLASRRGTDSPRARRGGPRQGVKAISMTSTCNDAPAGEDL